MRELENIFLDNYDSIKYCFTKRTIDGKNNNDIIQLCKENGFNYENISYNTQVHGDVVRVVKEGVGNADCADALITNRKDTPLMIFTADCVPLIFFDSKKQVIALAHAGWKGTYLNIGGKVINSMINDFNCTKENIKVIIGPSISVDSYEVSKELIEKFSKLNVENFYKIKNGSYYLDLWQINRSLLEKTGVKNIELSSLCTVRDNEKFFSYRKDKGTEKRIATLIQIN